MLEIANIKALQLETERARREVIIFKIGKVSEIFHDLCFTGTVIVLTFNVL